MALHRRLLVYSDAGAAGATSQIRLWQPLQAKGFELLTTAEFAPGKTLVDSVLDRPLDALIVHRAIKKRCSIYPALLQAMRARQVPVIHDTDDLLAQVHPQHPDHSVYQAKVGYALKSIVDADVVVASTHELAQRLAGLHPSVVVIPNELPKGLWQEACGRRADTANLGDGDRVNVGYLASPTHRPDLEAIETPLLTLLDRHEGRVRLQSVGTPLPARLKRHAWAEEIVPSKAAARSYAEYVRFAAALPIQIGIAPLLDTPFNRCKSGIKFQEYAALGIAGVYADLPPYATLVRNGVNGFLARNATDWHELLDRLVTSPGLRRGVAEAAANQILAGWRQEAAGEAWLALLSQIRDGGLPPAPCHPLAPAIEQILQYQAGLERQLKRSLSYHVGKAWNRWKRKLAG